VKNRLRAAPRNWRLLISTIPRAFTVEALAQHDRPKRRLRLPSEIVTLGLSRSSQYS
jgi:hypothetical protein